MMKYIGLVVVLGLIAFGAMFGLQSMQANKAYQQAESYISKQHEAGAPNVELAQFTKLRKIPDNIGMMENLTDVNAPNTDVSDLSAITGMKKLAYINLRNSLVQDISVFSTLPSLKTIDIGETLVRDLSPLTDCARLERLDISKTHTMSLEPVTRIEQLNWLNLYMAMSDDGSKIHFDALMQRGNIEIQPGNRFAENYKPR